MLDSHTSKFPGNFTKFPFVLICASFALGIFLARNSETRWEILFALACSSTIATISFRNKIYTVYLLALAFFFLGGFCFRVEQVSVAPNRLKVLFDSGVIRSGDEFLIEGSVCARPEVLPGGYFLEVATETIIEGEQRKNVSGAIRLFIPTEDPEYEKIFNDLKLNSGAKLKLRAQLRREERFRNPGVVSAKEILDQRNIDASGAIKDISTIAKISDGNFSPMSWVYDQRQNLIDEFRKRFEMQTAGVLSASLLGNQRFIDKPTAESFREGGTFHVLVISGMQITVIGTLAFLLLRIFIRRKIILFAVTNLFLWVYVIAVGADPPVVRAGLMFSVLHFASVIDRNATPLNSLGATLFLLLVWQPSDLFNQSFQLTSVCVIAILGMAFPLIEKMRAIGSWQPATETPFPPHASRFLKTICEALYWSERAWKREQTLTVWSCKLTKTNLAAILEERGLQKVFRYAFELLLVSIVVQLWMIPLIVVYFHRVSIAALFLNIWVGILMAIESIVALTAILIAQISEIMALPLIKLTELLNFLLVHLGDPFIENGWTAFRVPHYSGKGFAIYFAYFVPLIVFLILVQTWKPLALKTPSRNLKSLALIFGLIACVFVAIVFIHPFSSPKADGRLHVEFLDVGQGDSALITFPDGKTLLIDGGGRPSFGNPVYETENGRIEKFTPDVRGIGENVVSVFLWERGYDRVDYILATHADADHIQGLTEVAANFKIGEALFARRPQADEDFRQFSTSLERFGIADLLVGGGQVFEIGGARLEILSPIYNADPSAAYQNNDGLVARISFGKRSFLFLADIEKETERKMLAQNLPLEADVVKVAHHGSKTSSTSEFIAATRAKFAVISVGLSSPYGHPRAEVIERWKSSGANALTTGENGTVSFSSDGNDLRIETFLQPPNFR